MNKTKKSLCPLNSGYEIDALYTPTFRLSLFSVNQLDSAGSIVTFGGGKCSISSPRLPITITGHRVNDLYFISPTVASAHTASTLDELPSTPPITVSSTHSSTDSSTVASQSLSSRAAPTIAMSTRSKKTRSILTVAPTSLSSNAPPSTPSSPVTSPLIAATKSKSTRKALTISQSKLWHCRIAPMHPTSVRSLIPEYTNDNSMCTVCIQAKQTQKFIRVKVQRTSKPFQLVHSDVCGPFSTPYEMLHAFGKTTHDDAGNKISYKAPIHHLRRFGSYVSKLIPEAQRRSKFGPRSKPCMSRGGSLDVVDRRITL